MHMRLRSLSIGCSFVFVIRLSACASEDDFECEVCKDDRNCTGSDPNDHQRYLTSVADCPSGICYVVFGTKIGERWPHIETENPFVSLGCSNPGSTTVPTFDRAPFGVPVFAPLPPPERRPALGQYVCRKNGPLEDLGDIKDSMSCFCYTPRCQKELKEIAANGLFRGNLIRALPVEGTDWVIVDQLGAFKEATGVKKYDPFKPSDGDPASFSCGECPCNHGIHCKIGRLNCTREGPSLFTIATTCHTAHCYLTFGTALKYDTSRTFVSRGCSSATDEEYVDAKRAIGNPLFYAWPAPEPVPKPGQWACRRNRPLGSYQSTVTCFCFTSMCQAGYNPGFDEFRNHVHSNLALGTSWVIVDGNGQKVEPQSKRNAWPGMPHETSLMYEIVSL